VAGKGGEYTIRAASIRGGRVSALMVMKRLLMHLRVVQDA